jgi:hypothetical protein
MTHAARVACLRILLQGTNPVIWRRVEVPLTTSLKGLHDVIQAVMPFQGYHLFQFEIGGDRYGIPHPEWDQAYKIADARKLKLGALVDAGVQQFAYTYDFGDDWNHTISIETTAAENPACEYPR